MTRTGGSFGTEGKGTAPTKAGTRTGGSFGTEGKGGKASVARDPHKSLATTLGRLKSAKDSGKLNPEQTKLVEAEIRRMGADLPDRDRSVLGLVGKIPSAHERVRDAGGSVAATVLRHVARPGQAVLSAMAEGSRQAERDNAGPNPDVFTASGDLTKKNAGNVFKALRKGWNLQDEATPMSIAKEAGDIRAEQGRSTKSFGNVPGVRGFGDLRTNPLGAPEKLRGVSNFTYNMGGSIATDPLSYLTFGAGSAAKQAVGSATKIIGVERAGVLTTKGLKGLTEAERATLAAELTAKQLKALKLARGGVSVHAMGKRATLVPGHVIGKATAPTLGRVKSAITSSRFSQMVADGLRPRAAVRRAAGQEGAEYMDDVRSEFMGSRSAAINDDLVTIRSAVRKAHASTDDLTRYIAPALDVGAAGVKVPKHLRPVLEAFKVVRQKLTDDLQAEGMLGDEAAGGVDDYLSRVLTKEGRAWVEEGGGSIGAGGGLGSMPTTSGVKDPFLRQRRLMRDSPIPDINAVARGEKVTAATKAALVGSDAGVRKLADLAERAVAKATEDAVRLGQARGRLGVITGRLDARAGGGGLTGATGQVVGRAQQRLHDAEVAAAKSHRRVARVADKVAQREAKVGALAESGELSIQKMGANLFEENPVTAMVSRTARGRAAIATKHAFEKLVELKTVDGTKLIRTLDEAGGQGARLAKGHELVDVPGVGKFVAPSEIANEVKATFQLGRDEVATKAFLNFIDKVQTSWKGYATVPLISGVGFHSRNFMGNVWNNHLAGGIEVAHYNRARRIQVAMARGAHDGDPMKLLNAPDRELVAEARNLNVTGGSFFGTDLGRETARVASRFRDASRGEKAGRLGRAVNPLNRENVMLDTGGKFGQAIEVNARLAHFIAKREAYGSGVDAARSVRKYLFDYADLTHLEQKAFRRVHAFYTFTRKNTPLQIAALLESPQKFNRYTQARVSLADSAPAPDDGLYPSYLAEQAGTPTSLNTPDGRQLVIAPDLPFLGAGDTLTPFVNLAATLPGARRVLPQNQSGADGAVRDLLANNIVGGVPGAVSSLAQVGAGKTFFSGAPIRNRDVAAPKYALLAGKKTVGGESIKAIDQRTKFLLEANLPMLSKVSTAFPTSEGDQDKSFQKRLSALSGVRSLPLGESTSKSEAYRRLEALRQIIDDLEASGVDVPAAERKKR